MNKFVALLASISTAFSPVTVFSLKTPMKLSDHESVWALLPYVCDSLVSRSDEDLSTQYVYCIVF